MLKILSDDLWKTLARKSKNASRRKAAIAYLGESPPITFDREDTLIVDASDASIKCGRTSAKTLSRFHGSGTRLYSLSNLHAKFLLIDDWAVIGSANASVHSANVYIEAAVITDRPEVAGQLEQLLSRLLTISTPIDSKFLSRISRLPVTRTFTRKPVVKKPARSKTTPRHWLLSLHGDGVYRGNEDAVNEVSEEEQQRAGSKAGEVSWFWWPPSHRFARDARVGDLVIEAYRPRLRTKTSRSVVMHRHARILKIFQEPGIDTLTYHCLWPPDYEERKLSWGRFSELARRAGISRKISYRGNVELTEAQSSALSELWPTR